MDTSQQLSPSEAAELRQKLISQLIEPNIRTVFSKAPDVQSAVLLVAQYWSDEAEDAVHETVRYSAHRDPDVANFMTWSRLAGEGSDVDDSDQVAWRRVEYEVEQPGSLSPESLDVIATERWTPPFWDGNHDPIPAFAGFCEEGAHQEMWPGEAERPYAIFRRAADGIDCEVIGEMLRPDHDGLPSENAQMYGGMQSDPAASPRSLIKKLFGRN